MLPILILRMIPGQRCTGCGQRGYCEDKSGLCCGCLNLSLLNYAKRREENFAEQFSRFEKKAENFFEQWKEKILARWKNG